MERTSEGIRLLKLSLFSQKKIGDAIGRRCLQYFRIGCAFSCLRQMVSMPASAEGR